MTDDEKTINLIAGTILFGEGAYNPKTGVVTWNLLEYGGSPHGVGVLQWTFTRSFSMLKMIYDKYGWFGTKPPDKIKVSIEQNKPWKDYFFSSNDERLWLIGDTNNPPSKTDIGYIGGKEGQDIQKSLLKNDCSFYFNTMKEKGLTNYKSMALLANVMNAYGNGILDDNESANNDFEHCKNEVMRIFGHDRAGNNYVPRFQKTIDLINTYDYNNPQFNFINGSTSTGEPATSNLPTKKETLVEKVSQKSRKVNGGWKYKLNQQSYSNNNSNIIESYNGIFIKLKEIKKEIPKETTPPKIPATPTPPNQAPAKQSTKQPQDYADTIADIDKMIKNGTGIQNGAGYQCVALIWGVYGQASSLNGTNRMFDSFCHIVGGAKDLADKNQANWHKIDFSQRMGGDIIVWRGGGVWQGVAYGHIAIIANDINCVYEQNAGGVRVGNTYLPRCQNAGFDSVGNRPSFGLSSCQVWRLNGY